MLITLSFEMLAPQGSVAFQAKIPILEESVRYVRKQLAPAQVWTWRLGFPRDSIGVFAVNSERPVTVTIAGKETVLEGQGSTDFAMVFARRGSESFGELPFDGDLAEITVKNDSSISNHVTIYVAEREPESPVADPETSDV